jgi:hypothetical protein
LSPATATWSNARLPATAPGGSTEQICTRPAALHCQLYTSPTTDEEELPAPGYTLSDPGHTAIAAAFATTAREALTRLDPL